MKVQVVTKQKKFDDIGNTSSKIKYYVDYIYYFRIKYSLNYT